MDGFLRIHGRPPAMQRHVQLRAHVAGLTRELIERESDPSVLEGLRALFQDPKMDLKPARGARHDSPYELAVTAVHDRLAAIRRPLRCEAENATTRTARLSADAHFLI